MIPFGRNYSDRLEPQTGSEPQIMEAAGIEPANRSDRLPLRRIAKAGLAVALGWALLEVSALVLVGLVWSLT